MATRGRGAGLRAAVVGARRRRQGIGAHLARFVAAEGARLVGIAGTSDLTVGAARQALSRDGLEPEGYLDVRRMLETLRPDVLVIASPASTHDAFLTLGREAGCHVLCEKPLCWDVEEAAGHADRHAGAFLAQGLHLAVNTQWPHTLEAYRALHPGILDEPPHSFSMRLSPDGVGAGMIPEAVPHALSLLQAVLPDPEALVARPGARLLRPDASALELTFDYLAGGCEVACRVTLVRGRGQPREAAFAFDGHPARRRVEMGGYRLFLEDGRRSVPLPDPVPRRVGDFLGAVASGEPPRVDPAAVPGMRMLVDLHEAVLHEASCTGEGAT